MCDERYWIEYDPVGIQIVVAAKRVTVYALQVHINTYHPLDPYDLSTARESRKDPQNLIPW